MGVEQKLVVVVTTVAGRDEAERMGRALVEARLAACVQFEPISSVYRWEGTVEMAAEYRLTAKTTRERCEALMARITELHGYDTPEIIAVPVAAAAERYSEWVEAETG